MNRTLSVGCSEAVNDSPNERGLRSLLEPTYAAVGVKYTETETNSIATNSLAAQTLTSIQFLRSDEYTY
jgi:hypothetical protein